MEKRIKLLLFDVDFEYLEFFSSITAIGWGVVLAINPDILKSSLYSGFIGYPAFWVLISTAIGTLQGLAVYKNQDRNLKSRRLVTLLAVFFWLFITFEFLLSPLKISTAIPVYLLIAISNCWSYIRLSIRQRRVKDHNAFSK